MSLKARLTALEAKRAQVNVRAVLGRWAATGAPDTATAAERAVVDEWRSGAARLFGDTGEVESSIRQLERCGYHVDAKMRAVVAFVIAAEVAR